MSHWDGTKIVRWEPRRYEGYDGWWLIDCGCCGGTEWSGYEPRECGDCGGAGSLAMHGASGALAQYPGGPFVGHATPEEVAALREAPDA